MTLRSFAARHPVLVNLAVAGVTVLVMLAVFEGAARLFSRAPAPSPVAAYITDWANWEGEFYTVKSTAVGWPPWEDYNKEGLRDREHVLAKPKGVLRVACLGDSVTLGWGIPPESAYPQQLQDRLDARGQDAEVLNVALGGWTTRQELIAYRRIARRYRPDHVILGICLNDIPEMQNNLSRPPLWLTALFRRSALVRLAVGAERHEIADVDELFLPAEPARVREAYDKVFSDLRTLRREVQADGATLGVIVFPFRLQVLRDAPPPRPQERLAVFSRTEGLPFLDLLPMLRPLGESAFHDYDHLTPDGARAVADTVAGSGWFGATPGSSVLGAAEPDASELATLSMPALIVALDDPAPLRRAAAAWALSERDVGVAVAARTVLERRMADQAPEVRAAAARALGRLGPAPASTSHALALLLDDANEKVRWRAAEALDKTAPDAACCLEGFVAIAARPAAPGRGAAVWLLGRLGSAAATTVPVLSAALQDPREDVRWKAAWSLGEMGDAAREAVPALTSALDDEAIRWRVADALGGIGPAATPAVPALLPLVHDPASSVRFRVAKALGRIAPQRPEVAAALVSVAHDPQENVRLAAVRALGQEAPGEAVVACLIDALHDPDARVRSSAAESLGRRATASAAPGLLAALDDADTGARLVAARALRKIAGATGAAITGLAERAARERDPAVRAELERAVAAPRR